MTARSQHRARMRAIFIWAGALQADGLRCCVARWPGFQRVFCAVCRPFLFCTTVHARAFCWGRIRRLTPAETSRMSHAAHIPTHQKVRKEMSYLDDEIVKNFNQLNIEFEISQEAEHDLIVEKINAIVPFFGNQIAWSQFKENTYIGPSPSQATLALLEKKIKEATKHNVIFIGDATDNAYLISATDLMQSLQIFSKIPQHTYILQKQLDWIACISFEGDIDFAIF